MIFNLINYVYLLIKNLINSIIKCSRTFILIEKGRFKFIDHWALLNKKIKYGKQ